jgi:hypothetical protein
VVVNGLNQLRHGPAALGAHPSVCKFSISNKTECNNVIFNSWPIFECGSDLPR